MGGGSNREPTIYVLSKYKKNITFFHLKIIIFTAVKNCSILNGRVFVMSVFGRCNLPFHRRFLHGGTGVCVAPKRVWYHFISFYNHMEGPRSVTIK